MKIRKWHIYIIAVLCFVFCFVAINMKYDSFYRVNGINNDNRSLIEQYLDEEQQQYLVDNSIAVDQFIQYITIPGFDLHNYEYYNMLAKARIYDTDEDVVSHANTITTRLQALFGGNSLAQCRTLVSNNLVSAFYNNEAFDFQNIEYYQIIRALYEGEDYQYVSDTNTYVTKLNQDGILETSDKITTFKQLADCYDRDSLELLLTTPLPEGVEVVYNPEDLTALVDGNHFIGSYEPKHNVLVSSDLDQNGYPMYMEEEAYEQYVQLYQAMRAEIGSGMFLRKSYRPYEVLQNQESTELEIAGYSEYQLGRTITLQEMDVGIDSFGGTKSFAWLTEHAHEYGYILRYPEGKEEVTKHTFVPSIYRYVGVELATELHEKKLTLEEYHAQAEVPEDAGEQPL